MADMNLASGRAAEPGLAIGETLIALLDAHQLWVDCTYRFIQAELLTQSPENWQPSVTNKEGHLGQSHDVRANSRHRAHMILARAEYEGALAKFRAASSKRAAFFGSNGHNWCEEIVQSLEPARYARKPAAPFSEALAASSA